MSYHWIYLYFQCVCVCVYAQRRCVHTHTSTVIMQISAYRCIMEEDEEHD